MLHFLLFSSLYQLASSTSVVKIPNHAISSASRVGQRLLSRTRHLAADGEDGAQDFSWMSGYSIKFEHCVPNARCDDDDGCTSLVHFSLCPAESSCAAGCSGGTGYVVDMHYFLDAFTEAQLGADEYACEMARESCGDENECYESYGLDYCKEEQHGKFNLQEYLECNEFGDDGDDPHYLGPYCSSDGYSIYLGLFADDACITQASDDTFDSVYGYKLDFSSSSGYSIVTNQCAYCKDHNKEEHQDGKGHSNEDNVLEPCEELYVAASICEENSGVDNPDLSACDYVAKVKSNMAQKKWRGRHGGRFWRRVFIVGLIIALLLCCFW